MRNIEKLGLTHEAKFRQRSIIIIAQGGVFTLKLSIMHPPALFTLLLMVVIPCVDDGLMNTCMCTFSITVIVCLFLSCAH